MGKVSESIFSGLSHIIPMADVSHVERDVRKGFEGAISVITNKSWWNCQDDCWANVAYLPATEAEEFLKAWCYYRHELEFETIKNIESGK